MNRVKARINKIVLVQSSFQFIVPILLLVFGFTEWYKIGVSYIVKYVSISSPWINRIYFSIVLLVFILVTFKFVSFLYTVLHSYFEVNENSIKVSIASFTRKYESEMPLHSIENIHMYQNAWESLLRYGTILVEGKGGGKMVLPMVSDVENVYKKISENIKNSEKEQDNIKTEVTV